MHPVLSSRGAYLIVSPPSSPSHRMLLSIVYDGHARNVANLPMDVFTAFTIASATELPADLLLIATLDRWGRRWLAFGTLVLSGFFSILTIAFPGAAAAGLRNEPRVACKDVL